MKRIYWRPPRISRSAMALVAFISLCILALVESLKVKHKQPWFEEKTTAAQLTREAFEAIKAEKAARKIVLDPEVDPAGSGMLGVALSPVTSNTGYLEAKRATANPNFAAVLVHLLRQIEVREGDLIAVGASGSFPALNVAVLAAIQTLRLEPIVIASISASQFGANDPGLLWLDMERVLFDKGMFRFRSIAASPGGVDDCGIGLSEEGRDIIRKAALRNGVELLEPESLGDAIERRMSVYRREAQGRPIKAYINVGGGSASVGTRIGKRIFKPGLNRHPPRGSDRVDSVMLRFSQQGIPIIHLTSIVSLAKTFGLERVPNEVPPVGQSNVFVREGYNRWLAGGGLILILLIMLALLRLDVGRRILRDTSRVEDSTRPQQMI